MLQGSQLLQMGQARVRDLRLPQGEPAHLTSPARCDSPSSVMAVWPSWSIAIFFSLAKVGQPGVTDRRLHQVQVRQLRQVLRCFSPSSSTLVLFRSTCWRLPHPLTCFMPSPVSAVSCTPR